jgi:hypothetical protein
VKQLPEEQPHGSRSSRIRHRFAERRALWADRRARRKARAGADPDSAARQAESGNFQSGGYFTTKTHDKP